MADITVCPGSLRGRSHYRDATPARVQTTRNASFSPSNYRSSRFDHRYHRATAEGLEPRYENRDINKSNPTDWRQRAHRLGGRSQLLASHIARLTSKSWRAATATAVAVPRAADRNAAHTLRHLAVTGVHCAVFPDAAFVFSFASGGVCRSGTWALKLECRSDFVPWNGSGEVQRIRRPIGSVPPSGWS